MLKFSRIIIGSDHAGFETKTRIIDVLREKGIKAEDAGAHSKESSDYPDFGMIVGEAVSSGNFERGVLICGSGVGMSIVANKFPGVRAALVGNVETAKISRLHNNSNILVIGERTLDPKKASDILMAWLEAEFEGGRHQRRLDKIEALEKKLYSNLKR